VPGFDLHSAIDACSEHLVQFGGHKYAAGLTIELNKIDDFTNAFDKDCK
jgi:single-stranded-DNA-specific exonuclease